VRTADALTALARSCAACWPRTVRADTINEAATPMQATHEREARRISVGRSG